MLKKLTKKNKGFTLIELLVVIAIIGVLSGIVIVAVGDAARRARDSRRLADVRQLSFVLERELALRPAALLAGCTGTTQVLTTACNNPDPSAIIRYFPRVVDPVGTGAALCLPTSTTPCQYSIRRNTAAETARTDDYRICFFLETDVDGAGPLEAGLNRITTGGLILSDPVGVAGCP